MGITKNRKKINELVDRDKVYNLKEAVDIIKKTAFTKFDSSIELHFRLGVDPKQANQMVRGVATLPHGTGKEIKVLVLTTSDKEEEAKAAGADYVGLDEYVQKIQAGWTDIDVIICSPNVMPQVGRLGRVLGPRGLMPNPKSGTVTPNVGQAVKDVKAGKIDFKVDKTGIIHCAVGKASFSEDQIFENVAELTGVISRMKPASSKGTYFKSIFLSSTMGPGLKIEMNSIPGL